MAEVHRLSPGEKGSAKSSATPNCLDRQRLSLIVIPSKRSLRSEGSGRAAPCVAYLATRYSRVWPASLSNLATTFLFGDDLVLNLVVGRLRNNLFAHQISLHLIRTPVDDLLRIGFADSWQRVELFCRSRVDVQQLCFACGRTRARSAGLTRALRYASTGKESQREERNQNPHNQTLSHGFSFNLVSRLCNPPSWRRLRS